jgi:hypothetical protein
VKSPVRDRPSQPAEASEDDADDDDEDEDYDYASSGPIGAGMTKGDQLPPASSTVGELAKTLVTSLGLSPPPDDDNDEADGGTTARAQNAGGGVAVTERQEITVRRKVAPFTEKKPLTARRPSVVFLSDTDEGARRESAPSGDAAHS